MPHFVSLVYVVILCVVACLFWWRFIRKDEIRRVLDNLPGPEAESLLTGNLARLFGREGWNFHRDVALNYGPVVNYKGLLGRPALYISDPKALYSILVKDMYTFEESAEFAKMTRVFFGPSIASSFGDQHRKQRKMLTPVFSVNHMRHLLPTFYEITHKMQAAITSRVHDGPQEIDVADWMGRAALEIIGQGGLGYSLDPLIEDSANVLGEAIKAFVPALSDFGPFRFVIPALSDLGTAVMQRRVVDLFPSKRVQRMKWVVDTMEARTTQIFQSKKAAVLRGDKALSDLIQTEKEKDLISVLIRENLASSEGDRLPDDELLAQMGLLTFAAMDTTSTAMSLILSLLAERPQVQDRLRQEIVEAQNGEDSSYDQLMQLPFLDAVCRESLRIYPPGTSINRDVVRDTVLPLAEPIRGKDRTLIHELPVSRGTFITIGIVGWNCSKAIWGDDALEWKPERWLSPLPAAVSSAHICGVYSNLMTFLGGGRSCIGFKFAEMEMKVVLSVLLSTFRFELSDKDIKWNLAHVRYPSVGDSTKTSLPLNVSLLPSAAVHS